LEECSFEHAMINSVVASPTSVQLLLEVACGPTGSTRISQFPDRSNVGILYPSSEPSPWKVAISGTEGKARRAVKQLKVSVEGDQRGGFLMQATAWLSDAVKVKLPPFSVVVEGNPNEGAGSAAAETEKENRAGRRSKKEVIAFMVSFFDGGNRDRSTMLPG
ncbi:MAG: hypothetical protein Q9191_005598, partial [Dirinaria sp. TL-2023a]